MVQLAKPWNSHLYQFMTSVVLQPHNNQNPSCEEKSWSNVVTACDWLAITSKTSWFDAKIIRLFKLSQAAFSGRVSTAEQSPLDSLLIAHWYSCFSSFYPQPFKQILVVYFLYLVFECEDAAVWEGRPTWSRQGSTLLRNLNEGIWSDLLLQLNPKILFTWTAAATSRKQLL